jgi:hypothetical protein
MAAMLTHYLWTACVSHQSKSVQNAQTGMAAASLNNSGSR